MPTPLIARPRADSDGEVHIGIRQGDPRFESSMLPPDEVLAACNPGNELGKAGLIDIGHLAAHPLLLPQSGYSIRRLFGRLSRRRGHTEGRAGEPLAADATCVGRGWAWCRNHSVDAEDETL